MCKVIEVEPLYFTINVRNMTSRLGRTLLCYDFIKLNHVQKGKLQNNLNEDRVLFRYIISLKIGLRCNDNSSI